ncbi:MAG: hypothetical protein IJW08_03605 [Lentisphaeria bacterium]|nr:hypothetical protein [Lentisphaeria bacterium]MBR7118943.1 hypothetical protein [Lentisphaeria bacterium]
MRIASLILLSAVVITVLAAGCTERERMGYSAIPQNSPGAWEMSPYGDLRN